MKIVELLSNIQLHLNNEEADMLAKFDITPLIKKSELNEREQHVISQLVVHGVVIRKKNNGKIEYRRHIKDRRND